MDTNVQKPQKARPPERKPNQNDWKKKAETLL
jgi:hypothetical protein